MDPSWIIIGIVNMMMLVLAGPLFKAGWVPIEFNKYDLITEIHRRIPVGMPLQPERMEADDISTFCFQLPRKKWRRWKTYDKFVRETAEDTIKHFEKMLLEQGVFDHSYVYIGATNVVQSAHKRKEGIYVTVQIMFSVRDPCIIATVVPEISPEAVSEKEENITVPLPKVRSIIIFKKGD